MFQGIFHTHISIEFPVEVFGCISLVVHSYVVDNLFWREQSSIQAEAVKKRFQGGARLAYGRRSIHFSPVQGIIKISRTQVSNHLMVLVINNDNGCILN